MTVTSLEAIISRGRRYAQMHSGAKKIIASVSSGYGRRLMFKRSRVQIPAPDTLEGHLSHYFFVKIVLMFV